MAKTDVELYGRKTFFIAPDASLVPKAYLEEFILRGYETYIINDDYTCPIQKKVREIIRLFPDSILYFNVDSTIEGIEWKSYLRELSSKFRDEALFGVFYSSRANASEEEKLKAEFSSSSGVSAGCFALSARNHENFESILSVLEKIKAKGRRNSVRAHCDAASSLSFEFNGVDYSGKILDVNISHFRCEMIPNSDHIQIFNKIRGVSFNINGESFLADAVLIMKRKFGGKDLGIFMFIRNDDLPDLSPEVEKRLNQKIYQIVLNENMEKLQKAFKSADN